MAYLSLLNEIRLWLAVVGGLNEIGLWLAIGGGVIIFCWGPPQPSFQGYTALAVGHSVAGRTHRRRGRGRSDAAEASLSAQLAYRPRAGHPRFHFAGCSGSAAFRAMIARRPVPKRHWRRYGDDTLPTER